MSLRLKSLPGGRLFLRTVCKPNPWALLATSNAVWTKARVESYFAGETQIFEDEWPPGSLHHAAAEMRRDAAEHRFTAGFEELYGVKAEAAYCPRCRAHYVGPHECPGPAHPIGVGFPGESDHALDAAGFYGLAFCRSCKTRPAQSPEGDCYTCEKVRDERRAQRRAEEAPDGD